MFIDDPNMISSKSAATRSDLERFLSMHAEKILYGKPIFQKEINNEKVMLFNAMGIPKENITYDTEFINKTKQTYLNIRGCAELIDLGFENDINIHILIDTDIYDGYEVNVNDGMVMVVLHEIKNESPNLKDFGREKFIKSCE